nr:MAG: hypothetical protein CSA04_00940 [Bacteroidota bacterium]
MIKDSLNLNPINTGIVGGIGLRYMLDNTLQYVKRGDIVIVAPEYGRFYVKTGECLSPLLRTILDVKKSDIRFLRWRQYFSFITGLPTYVFSKFRLREYVFFSESDVYGVDSFNEYGDASAHWNLKRRDFFPYKKSPDEGFNDAILQDLKAFEEGVKDRGAIMMVSYPGLQDISFENIFEKVARVEKEYTKAGFRILGSPHRYKMPDSLMFDTPYHLSKRGVDRRTALFIEDFKSARQLSY